MTTEKFSGIILSSKNFFESDKLTYSDIELIKKIQSRYIKALIMKNNLKYLYITKLQKIK